MNTKKRKINVFWSKPGPCAYWATPNPDEKEILEITALDYLSALLGKEKYETQAYTYTIQEAADVIRRMFYKIILVSEFDPLKCGYIVKCKDILENHRNSSAEELSELKNQLEDLLE